MSARNTFLKRMQIGYVIGFPIAILSFLLSKPFTLYGIPGYYSTLASGVAAWTFLLLVERSRRWAYEVMKTCLGLAILTFLIVKGLEKLPFAACSPIGMDAWQVVLGSVQVDNIISFYLIVSICIGPHLLWNRKKSLNRRESILYGGIDLLLRGLFVYLVLGGYKLWCRATEEGYLYLGSGAWFAFITLLGMVGTMVYDTVKGAAQEGVAEGDDADVVYLRLLALFLTLLLLTNIVSVRYVWVASWLFTSGLLVYPFTFLLTDLISELYGRRRAEETVLAGLGASVWMGVWTCVVVSLEGDEVWDFAYATFFSFTPGMIISSMSAYLVGQWLDVQIFHALKKATKGRYLWLRNNVGTIISQLVDTLVFGVIVWGLWPKLVMAAPLSGSVWSRLVRNECIGKIVFALCDTPFLYLILYWIKRNGNIKSR